MNTLDIVSLVLILILSLLGIWRGFLRGIFRLIAWGGAIAGAYYANDLMADTIQSYGFGAFSTTIICIAIGFLVPFLLLHFIGHLLNKAIADTKFGTADRVLGGILGFIKAFMILFALFTILHIMPFGETVISTRDDSASYSVYKTTLELMGFSSEPIDLVNVAEQKASELTNNIVEKASDKAAEVAKEATDKATEAAKEIATETVKSVTEKATEEAKKVVEEKASEVLQ